MNKYQLLKILPVHILLQVLLAATIVIPSYGQDSLRTYTTTHVHGKPPVIDGKGDDVVWELTEWSGDFIQREPYENEDPSQQTAFKILYDDNNLYVLIRAFDTEPDKIERRLARRDSWEGDFVSIAIDSYNDDLTGFVFAVNAAGVKNDGIVTNDTDFDDTWNPVWYVKVSIDKLGWLSEMKIPFTQLRFANSTDHVWGLELLRILFRKEEMSLWQMVPQQASGWVSLWGNLHGIEDIKPKKEVELIPYVMGNIKTYEKEEGNPYMDGTDPGFNAGLNGKVAITNDLTLNFTINPDFGQVEADPSQVNLTAFETFYEEKRPFFIEGSNIYDYPVSSSGGFFGRDNLFYSRRIGRRPQYYPDLPDDEYVKAPEFTRILGAVKLSGKTQNGWSVGVLESITKNEKAKISNNGEERKEVIEPLTNYFNTRIQKDINKGNTTIGGMITATNRFINDSTLEFLPTSAYTQGIDFQNFWKEKTFYISLKTVFSEVYGSKEAITELQEAPQRYYQRPDATHISVDTTKTSLFGNGGTVEGGKASGHWTYGGRFTWRTPGLDLNDMGFLSLSDYFNEAVWGGYRLWEPFSIFRRMNINASQWSGWDFAGKHLYMGVNLNFNTQFKNYWTFGLGINRDFFDIDRHQLRGGPALRAPGSTGNWLNIGSDSRKKLSFGIFMHNRWGDDKYTRSFGAGLEILYRPLDFLQISIEPGYNNQKQQIIYVGTFDYNDEDQYVLSAIKQEIISADIRINLSITPDLSIQFWGQPFLFSGDYSDYKKVTDPLADNWRDQYHEFTNSEITYDDGDNMYLIDDNGDGHTDYSFDNPDFSFYEFRSNLVIRWEYIPGSTAYLVWSQGRTGDHPDGQFSFSENVNRLLDVHPENVFLLKISYRFSF
ncbi:MAG: hypothetical protein DRI88_03345 [Bacteroidetes bacterium]|nr:MAG: hypothetical protein DRI88_03345 [Bacteroidota bacterium]